MSAQEGLSLSLPSGNSIPASDHEELLCSTSQCGILEHVQPLRVRAACDSFLISCALKGRHQSALRVGRMTDGERLQSGCGDAGEQKKKKKKCFVHNFGRLSTRTTTRGQNMDREKKKKEKS